MSNYKSIYQIHQKTPIYQVILVNIDIYYYTTTIKEVNMQSWNSRTQQKVERMAQQSPDQLIWVYKKFEHAQYDNYRLYRVIPRESYGNIRRGGWIRHISVDKKK